MSSWSVTGTKGSRGDVSERTRTRRLGARSRVSLVAALFSLVMTAGVVTAVPASAAQPWCEYAASQSVKYYYPSTPNSQNAWFQMPATMQVGSANAFDCFLRRGHTGPGVSALQATINACYYYRSYPGAATRRVTSEALVVDGSFGAKTEAALKAVQAYEGITADGSFGNQTRSYLEWVAVLSTNTPGGVESSTSCWSRY